MNAFTRTAPVLALGTVLLCVGGCRREVSTTWSCFTPQRAACSQWGKTQDASVLDLQQASCRDMGGIVANRACPKSGAAGSCLTGTPSISRIVYYAPQALAEARRACTTLGGTWR